MKTLLVIGLLLTASCVSVQKLLPTGEISTDETELVPFWEVHDKVSDLLESKGYAVPEVSAGEMWLDVAMWCAGLAIFGFILYYATKIHEFGGGAAILGFAAVVCTGMAQIADRLWLIPAGAVIVLLFYVGLRIRDKSLFTFLQSFRKHEQ